MQVVLIEPHVHARRFEAVADRPHDVAVFARVAEKDDAFPRVDLRRRRRGRGTGRRIRRLRRAGGPAAVQFVHEIYRGAGVEDFRPRLVALKKADEREILARAGIDDEIHLAAREEQPALA